MGNSKLHEILAVESDLEGRAKTILNETKKVFKDKPALFMGTLRTYRPFVDDGIDYPEEQQDLTSTVNQKLKFISKFVTKYYDALLQKESTNQVAKADLVVDGFVIGKDLPATFLLGMESRLRSLRDVYANIPTLSIGTEWKNDSGKGEDVWVVSHPEETLKTVRTTKSKVLYEATEHHPAQIDKWEESENVGKYTKYVWSGMLTPARKSVLLDRIDNLIQEVKKARQRANTADVLSVRIGNNIMDYINQE